ncbi:bacteriocin immunity protein [Citrobacter arsenatis]
MEDSPEGVIREIKRLRQSQGLPLFKNSETDS